MNRIKFRVDSGTWVSASALIALCRASHRDEQDTVSKITNSISCVGEKVKVLDVKVIKVKIGGKWRTFDDSFMMMYSAQL